MGKRCAYTLGQRQVHRKQMGLPEFDEGSWKSGFDRLLLGYALWGNEEKLFHDILPMMILKGTKLRYWGDSLSF